MATKQTPPRKTPTNAGKPAATPPKKAATSTSIKAAKAAPSAKPAKPSTAAAADAPKAATRGKKPTKAATSLARAATLPAAAQKAKRSKAITAPRDTKLSQLIAQLRAGSTITQMTALTGWQPHSVRGVISGVLRKKLGLEVGSQVPAKGGERRYQIVASPAQA